MTNFIANWRFYRRLLIGIFFIINKQLEFAS